MKQLKFMLAAATAISLATAAQAEELSNENFNSYTDGQAVIGSDGVALIDGFSYTGTAGDNESTIIKESDGDMALKVNTGTDPLLRVLDKKNRKDVALAAEGFKSLNIDAVVQFTVTPDGDDVVPTSSDDKLLIYLKEDLENKCTNLIVRAAGSKVDENGEATGEMEENGVEYVVSSGEFSEIEPNTPYRLVVKAKAITVGSGYWPVFNVYLGGDSEQYLLLNEKEGGFETLNEDVEIGMGDFVSLQVTADNADGMLIKENEKDGLDLTYVGFAGEGLVDDLVVSSELDAPSSVDFTFTWTTAGITSVTYTIGDAEPVAVTNGVKIENLAPNAVLTLTVTPAEWYKVADNAVLSYTATKVGDSALLDDLVTVVTTKVDPDTGDVVVNPGESVTVADIQAAAGITEGAFFAEGTTKADLEKVLTWKNKNNANGKADINKITFSGVEPTSSEAEAYLLNCAPTEDAIKAKKDAFVFSAFTFDENGAPVVTVDPEFAGDVNGRIEIRGATSLDAEDAFTAPKKDGDAFFKAFLVK